MIELKNFDKNNYNFEEGCNNVLYFVKHSEDFYAGQIPNKQIVKDLTLPAVRYFSVKSKLFRQI